MPSILWKWWRCWPNRHVVHHLALPPTCIFTTDCHTAMAAASSVVDTFVVRKDVDVMEQEAGEFCSMDSILLDDIVGKLVAFSFSVYIWFLYVKEQENNNAASDPANFFTLQKNVIPTTVDGLIYILGYCVNISSQFVTCHQRVCHHGSWQRDHRLTLCSIPWPSFSSMDWMISWPPRRNLSWQQNWWPKVAYEEKKWLVLQMAIKRPTM